MTLNIPRAMRPGHSFVTGSPHDRESAASANSAGEAQANHDDDDDLNPIRGFLVAALLALPIWGVIGLVIWFAV